ncbi:hypothetical protein [Flavobacterium sp.]|uniref:hypothetical protein n=1 Tax=Flavobacterium sp. TaxID=239 RepID=UPI0039E2D592
MIKLQDKVRPGTSVASYTKVWNADTDLRRSAGNKNGKPIDWAVNPVEAKQYQSGANQITEKSGEGKLVRFLENFHQQKGDQKQATQVENKINQGGKRHKFKSKGYFLDNLSGLHLMRSVALYRSPSSIE